MRVFVPAFLLLLTGCSPAFAFLLGPTNGGGGGGDVFLTDATVVEPSGSAQTNMPFCLGLPFLNGVIDGSHFVKVIDNDTSSQILTEDLNRFSDLTPSIRGESVCGNIPSITGNEQKVLKLYVSSGSPPTGTDIAVSDIVAAATSSLNAALTITNLNGVAGTWTADPMTALNSGNNGWVNATTATVLGKYRSGGGLTTEYILFVPFAKSGTADAQMHAIFDVKCYKASRAAVSGGNPILGCMTDCILENAYVQQASSVGNYYGLSGCGASLSNSTPAITLTLGSSGVANNVTVTAGSSLFTANSLGQVIANGTGIAVVIGFTDATHAAVNIYTAFSSTTVGSGTYTLYGMNDPWGARYKFRAFWGPISTPNWPTVDVGQVYLGDPWNNGTLTGGPGVYLFATKLFMNYAFAASVATNDLTNLNAMGTNPSSYTLNNNGDLLLFLETSGQRPDIGVVPDWDALAVLRYDSNAALRIFGNAQRWASFSFGFRDQNTGLQMLPGNGTDYCYPGVAGFGCTAMAVATGVQSPWTPDGFAHDPEDFYTAYMLTGDYYWLDNQDGYGFELWSGNNPAFTGSGVNRVGFWGAFQERGVWWGLRTLADLCLMTPDTTPAVVGWTKTACKTYLSNVWTATNSGTAGTNPQPGFNISFVNNTGAGKTYPTDGIRYTVLSGGVWFTPLEVGYGDFALFHALEQGMLDANGQSALAWVSEGPISEFTDSGTNLDNLSRTFWASIIDMSAGCTGATHTDWATVYKDTSNVYVSIVPDGSLDTGVGRTPNVTMTLSATSGSSVTATLSGGQFGAGSSFYATGWITDSSFPGIGQIVSITDSNHAVISTSASAQYTDLGGTCDTINGHAFGGTTLTAGNYIIMAPASGDPAGTDWTSYQATPTTDMLQIHQADTLLAKEYGITGGSAAFTAAWALTSNVMSLYTQIKWNIQSR